MTQEERKKHLIEWYSNLHEFKDVDDIPCIPVVDAELYKNIIIPNLIRCGAIPKNKLEVGATYLGSCRNSSIAVWKGNVFEYMRTKFYDTFPEEINHFEDDDGYDVFVPIKKMDKNE